MKLLCNSVFTLFMATSVASNEVWNYKRQGDDWPNLDIDGNLCGTNN